MCGAATARRQRQSVWPHRTGGYPLVKIARLALLTGEERQAAK
ncbi:hypothetical protein [Raoultella terrigena]|nr:hypothetical protein [Raoultella terrigena]